MVANSTASADLYFPATWFDDQAQFEDEQDSGDEDTIIPNSEVLQDEASTTAIEATGDSTMIEVDKPTTEHLLMDEAGTPIKTVGCLFVTIHLQKYLEQYPSLSDKQAFLDLHPMLSLLDHYLYDNPRQHIYCMSMHNEYVTVLNYAICLHIDITTFPTIWAVLSILLDTQDN